MHYIAISKEPLDVNALYEKVKDPQFGGIVVFSGTVRQWTGDVETQEIEYTAYESMAIKELTKLAVNIEQKGANVVIVHRIGRLKLADEAVFVGVAAAHRAEAFTWCESLIDELKQHVPIWKKEFDTDQIRWGGPA
ncbi:MULTISPECIES: molybdenum cofactor biosynthesis protein MoaE [Loigolactobacillus]|uniref:Molybdenum cofactor biosynthesis protein E n=1 Tax=Loigolactobacillus backii TaxID=375175 RepID=A0A192H294_9LACO|nr:MULTISPECIES: molybdenum cofactor biosynthesis protein MoaE [Loigolactobacillus]ANK60436.1 molybdenum cofactor biosynthesis protein E [Loigolactobacillus backii]ANK62066.1 molybdenum cofactor biosynthesis protein E [Loigolactobacillus backii]ANK65315.1 molybdenum cofactor biosynthesis protein E [Loigolactobacillus backii]ANK68740.1 molybdenum cofactor biosynthesis protein E [Loigolactobacillus backii]MDA5386744.1 molybdenum cofactor biosynthesis protein MoaE [Loigolactobacillus backii]